jgi:hypothetical protein
MSNCHKNGLLLKAIMCYIVAFTLGHQLMHSAKITLVGFAYEELNEMQKLFCHDLTVSYWNC